MVISILTFVLQTHSLPLTNGTVSVAATGTPSLWSFAVPTGVTSMVLLVYPNAATSVLANGLILVSGTQKRVSLATGATKVTIDSTDAGSAASTTLSYTVASAVGFQPAANSVYKVCAFIGATDATDVTTAGKICGNYHTFTASDLDRNLGVFIGTTTVSGVNLTHYASFSSDQKTINVGAVALGTVSNWWALGINNKQMSNQDMFAFSPVTPTVLDYYSRTQSNYGPDAGGSYSGCSNNLNVISQGSGTGYMFFHFTRSTTTTDSSCDTAITAGSTTLCLVTGSGTSITSSHSSVSCLKVPSNSFAALLLTAFVALLAL